MQSVCHRVRSIRQGLAGRAETHVSTVRDTDVWKSVLVAVRDDATALPFPVSRFPSDEGVLHFHHGRRDVFRGNR